MTTFEERAKAEAERLFPGLPHGNPRVPAPFREVFVEGALWAAAQSGEQPAAETPPVLAARCPGGDGHAQIAGPVQFVGALDSVNCATCGKPRSEWVAEPTAEAAPEADERAEAIEYVRRSLERTDERDEQVIDTLIDGGWFAARRAAQTTTVTTPEELDALPPTSVIAEHFPATVQWPAGILVYVRAERFGGKRVWAAGEDDFTTDVLIGPDRERTFEVLYRPEAPHA